MVCLGFEPSAVDECHRRIYWAKSLVRALFLQQEIKNVTRAKVFG